MTVITGNRILLAQAAARRAGLKLEIKGMKRHGRSMYVICKEAYGFHGTRKNVLAQLEALIADWERALGIV